MQRLFSERSQVHPDSFLSGSTSPPHKPSWGNYELSSVRTPIPTVKPTRCTCYLKLFILVKHSTCFGRSFRPLSGAQDCTYSNRRMPNSCCYLKQLSDICLLLYVQSWAPDDGRKDRPKHVECFTRINNLRNRCILLVLLQEYITMHGPMDVKFTVRTLQLHSTFLITCISKRALHSGKCGRRRTGRVLSILTVKHLTLFRVALLLGTNQWKLIITSH